MEMMVGCEIDEQDVPSNIVDVVRMRLTEVLYSEETALDNSLRRILAEMDHEQPVKAGFSNSIHE